MSEKNGIRIEVDLDTDNQPKALYWDATGSNIDGKKESKAFMLKIFDKEENGTLSIDLWTKEFMIDEMNQLVFESIMTMSETFLKATKHEKAYQILQEMGKKFIEEAQKDFKPEN